MEVDPLHHTSAKLSSEKKKVPSAEDAIFRIRNHSFEHMSMATSRGFFAGYLSRREMLEENYVGACYVLTRTGF